MPEFSLKVCHMEPFSRVCLLSRFGIDIPPEEYDYHCDFVNNSPFKLDPHYWDDPVNLMEYLARAEVVQEQFELPPIVYEAIDMHGGDDSFKAFSDNFVEDFITVNEWLADQSSRGNL